MKLIKEYIKKIIIKEMAMMKAIDQRKTALMIKKSNNSLALYLYKPNFFYEIEKIDQQKRDLEYSGHKSFLVNSLFPDILIIKPNEQDKFVGSIAGLITSKLNDSISEVQFSRAEPGSSAGPMMYEIAMSLVGELTSDREVVSQEASSVWKKFFDRTDITHKKLPKELVNQKFNKNEPWLNYSYKLKKGVGQDIKILRSVHEMAVETFSQKTGMSIEEIEDTLYRILITRYNLD